MPNHVVIRTDKAQREHILAELEAGRLRQGWGHQPEQDLRKIAQKRRDGLPLTQDQRDAWGSRRMLDTEHDGLRAGDLVLCPHLPEHGQWILARVTGPYSYDTRELEGIPAYYRHCLPVEPLRTKDGKLAAIDPRNAHVDARLRQTMRNMRRLWSIDHLAEAVERLRSAIEEGADVSVAHGPRERRELFFAEVREAISNAVWAKLRGHVQGAELEHLLVPILESVYGAEHVEAVGGRGEKGADLMVEVEGPPGLRFRTAIQVKMHDGTTHDEQVVRQLRQAHEDRKAQAGVLLTTAVEVSPELEDKLTQLAEELGIDIQVWTRDDVVRLLLGYMLDAKAEV